MMRRYPAYRESGVDWLGEVPEVWGVVPIKRIGFLQSGNTITAERIEETGAYPVFGGNGLRGYTDQFTHEGEYALIGRQGALCGNINYGNGQFWASEHAIVVHQRKPFVTRWLGEVLRAMNLGQYSTSAAQPGVAVEMINELPIPLPPLAEQTAIAAFLDRETGKIDALVAEQRRLIELLREKRQATISHAVTRGLNPAAPLKPSGVDWLGDVPEGWEVVRLRRIIKRIEQGFSPDCFSYPASPDEWGVLKTGCVNRGIYNEAENKALPPEVEPRPELSVQRGDVLMSRASGSPELIGSVAFVADTQGKIMLSDKIFRLTFLRHVQPQFVVLAMGSTPIRAQIINAISGGEGMANNLPQAEIKEFWIAFPPLEEQTAIVAFLAEQTARLDTLTTTAESAISLLLERRAALISAAVTGKIDVREQEAA
jgi:type I restriction enzyme, S subunit